MTPEPFARFYVLKWYEGAHFIRKEEGQTIYYVYAEKHITESPIGVIKGPKQSFEARQSHLPPAKNWWQSFARNAEMAIEDGLFGRIVINIQQDWLLEIGDFFDIDAVRFTLGLNPLYDPNRVFEPVGGNWGKRSEYMHSEEYSTEPEARFRWIISPAPGATPASYHQTLVNTDVRFSHYHTGQGQWVNEYGGSHLVPIRAHLTDLVLHTDGSEKILDEPPDYSDPAF